MISTFGIVVTAIIALIVGVVAGGAVNMRNFGSSGVGIIGTGIVVVAALALATTTGALSFVGVGLAALLFGVFMRNAR